ncbi:MAG: hypothetical protein ACN4GW_01455 [Desulforhopalus sp.]
MELTGMTKQLINFQKSTFNHAFSGAIALQDYSENLMGTILSQSPWLNEESKKPICDSVKIVKSVTEEYKKVVDQGFAELEKLVG